MVAGIWLSFRLSRENRRLVAFLSNAAGPAGGLTPAALFERYRRSTAVVKLVCCIALPLPIERLYQRQAPALVAVSEARLVRAFVFSYGRSRSDSVGLWLRCVQ